MPKCNHNEEAKLLEVKKPGPNKGRKFYACPGPKGEQCDFFEWADTSTPRRFPAPSLPPRKEPDWDRIREQKEEGMTFLNAKNNAAVILAAAIGKGELTFADAMARYDEVTQFIYDIGNEKKEGK